MAADRGNGTRPRLRHGATSGGGAPRRAFPVSRSFLKFSNSFRMLTDVAVARFLTSDAVPIALDRGTASDQRCEPMIGSATSALQNLHWPRSTSSSSASETASTTSTSATSDTSAKNPLAELFASIDSDSSGGVSSSELSSFLDKFSNETRNALLSLQEESGSTSSTGSATDAFASIDADGDGSITEEELGDFMKANMPPPPPPPQDSASASDGSSSSDTTGAVSSTAASSLFSSIDTDSDGSISEDELTAAMQASAPPPPPPSGGTSSSGSSSSSDSSSSYSAADLNKDGTISADELLGYMSQQAGSTDSTSSSGTDSSSFASVIAQMLQQSYMRMQDSQSLQQSSLLAGLSSVA
jgi:Ca2+-binding EF-hand superfamily protein